MITYTVTIDSFKALLGKDEWSTEEFMSWVTKEIEIPSKSERIVELEDLS